MASLEEATSRRSPSGEASITPAADTPSTFTQRAASPVNMSMTSKSLTRVSASSTKDWTTEDSRVTSTFSPQCNHIDSGRSPGGRPSLDMPPMVYPECPAPLSGGPAGSREPQPSGDDVFGDVAKRTFVGEGVGAQTDQGLGDTDAELHRHGAGRVVHHEVQLGALLQLLG